MSIQLLKYEEIEGLRVGRFKDRVNTTCIVYRIGSTVIDTGPPNQWNTVRNFLLEKEIKQVLITHHHEDHGGNGSNIKKELKVPVYIRPEGIESLKKGFSLKFYQKIIWGKPKTFEAEVLPEQIELEKGVTLKTIHAPGHSDDMTCYLEPERGWLFTGDLFIASKPKFMRADEDPNMQIESLKLLLKYNFDKVFCSHRGIVLEGRKAIQDKIEYLETLQEKINNLYNQGKSVKEITSLLMGKESFISFFTQYHFSKRNMIECFINNISR